MYVSEISTPEWRTTFGAGLSSFYMVATFLTYVFGKVIVIILSLYYVFFLHGGHFLDLCLWKGNSSPSLLLLFILSIWWPLSRLMSFEKYFFLIVIFLNGGYFLELCLWKGNSSHSFLIVFFLSIWWPLSWLMSFER